MRSSAVALGVGALCLVLVASFVTSALRVPAVDLQPPVRVGEIQVGVIEMALERGLYVGTLVYGPSAAAADELAKDTGFWDFTRSERTPEPVREGLCLQAGGCAIFTNTTFPQGFLDNVTSVTRTIASDLGAPPGEDIRVTVNGMKQGGTLVLSLVRIEDATGRIGPPTENALQRLADGLGEACRMRALNESIDMDCEARYRDFSMFATWNPSRDAHSGLTDTNVSVLGPLAFALTSNATTASVVRAGPPEGGPGLFGSVVDAPGARVFLPTWALLFVAAAIVLAFAAQEVVEYACGNSHVPLPPFVLLAGVVLLWGVNEGWWDSWILFTVVFGVILVGWLLTYRLWDSAGIQFLSGTATLATLGAAGLVLLVRLKGGLLGDVEGLVQKLAANQAPAIAADAVRDALTIAFVVAAASLAVWVAATYAAYREGRAELERLGGAQRLLALPLDKLREELRSLDPSWRERPRGERPSHLSRYGYASLVAQVYQEARRDPGNAWIREAFFGIEAVPTSDDPVWASVLATRRERLDWLWDCHKETARRARRLADLLD